MVAFAIWSLVQPAVPGAATHTLSVWQGFSVLSQQLLPLGQHGLFTDVQHA
jgi:hypothetical protein